MKKLNVVIAALGLATVAPFASADTAQLELLPRVGGAEFTQYVATIVTSGSNQAEAIFYAHTGGVSPQ